MRNIISLTVGIILRFYFVLHMGVFDIFKPIRASRPQEPDDLLHMDDVVETATKLTYRDFSINFDKSDNMVAVPYLQVNIVCHYDKYDDLNEMTLFVLDSLYNAISVEDMIKTTRLEHVVYQELDFLSEHSYTECIDDHIRLTSKGVFFAELNSILKRCSGGIPAFLNLITDKIELMDEKLLPKDKVNSGIVVLPPMCLKNNVARRQLSCRDYSNSTVIAKDYCKTELNKIDFTVADKEQVNQYYRDVMDNIYTTIECQSFRDKIYRVKTLPYRIRRSPTKRNVSLITEVVEYQVSIKFSALDIYRKIIPSLKKISKSNPELLSEKGRRILSLYQKEVELLPITVGKNLVFDIIADSSNEVSADESGGGLLVNKAATTLNSNQHDGIRYEAAPAARRYERVYLDLANFGG